MYLLSSQKKKYATFSISLPFFPAHIKKSTAKLCTRYLEIGLFFVAPHYIYESILKNVALILSINPLFSGHLFVRFVSCCISSSLGVSIVSIEILQTLLAPGWQNSVLV